MLDARSRGRPRHPLHRGRPPRAPRHLPAARTSTSTRPGAAAGPRRRAGRSATRTSRALPLMLHLAAKGWVCVAINYRLAPRDAVPRPDRRRQAGDRLGQGAHRRLRRRPRLRRDHRRLGRRPPGRAGGADAGRPGVPARLRGRRHVRAGGGPALRRLRLRRRDRAARARSRCATGSSRRGSCRPGGPRTPSAFEKASPLLRVTPDAPDFFVLHGTHDTLVVGRAGTAVRRAAARGLARAASCTPSCRRPARLRRVPARSGAAHVVRAVDRFLHWHWNGSAQRGGEDRRHRG